MSLSSHFSDIIEYGLYASPLKDLNDPFEWIEIQDKENYRVVSLSKSRNKKMMFAYYGGGHGCCIEVEVTDESIIRKISYDKLTHFQQLRRTKTPEETLFHKDRLFEKENEYRVLFDCINPDPNHWTILRDNRVFLKCKVIRVYLSPSSQDYQSGYADALDVVRRHNEQAKNKSDRIEVKKLKLSTEKYQFVLDDTFMF